MNLRNKVLQLVHAVRLNPYPSLRDWKRLQELAHEAMKQHDEALVRIAQLEKELKNEKRAQLYGMTDLA